MMAVHNVTVKPLRETIKRHRKNSVKMYVFVIDTNFFINYLFNDNFATGGSPTGAILSCHVEL